MSGTKSRSKLLLNSLRKFFTTNNVIEVKEDEFYYDTQGIQHKIVSSMDDPNHLVMFNEFITTA